MIGSPAPAAAPMAAVTQMPAAVVSPRTASDEDQTAADAPDPVTI
jgi:hypothetical protein